MQGQVEGSRRSFMYFVIQRLVSIFENQGFLWFVQTDFHPKWHVKSLQSCLTLCDPMDQISPGFSVHGILQARILEWVAVSSCKGSSQPRDQTCISYSLNSLVKSICASIKKAECWRIDAFELWCLRRLLRVPWTARRSNQSILKVISPEYSLEGLMLKLKLQYFGHLMRWIDSLKRPWCWERLRAGGEGEDRGWDDCMASLTQWTWVNSRSWWMTGRPGMLQSMGSQRVGHDWATEPNWKCSIILSISLDTICIFKRKERRLGGRERWG